MSPWDLWGLVEAGSVLLVALYVAVVALGFVVVALQVVGLVPPGPLPFLP